MNFRVLLESNICSQRKIGPFFDFEHRFLKFSSQNRSKRLDFAHFKPILTHFRIRQTTLSTWLVLGNILNGYNGDATL